MLIVYPALSTTSLFKSFKLRIASQKRYNLFVFDVFFFDNNSYLEQLYYYNALDKVSIMYVIVTNTVEIRIRNPKFFLQTPWQLRVRKYYKSKNAETRSAQIEELRFACGW